MMADAVCNLHTGLQGNGKTLMTIAHVEALRISSGRPVFYSGIRGLTLAWTEFGSPSKDPEKPWWTGPEEWHKLPTGAIIVIDEAQRLFRPRANGSAVPDYEAGLEVLRHNGHTLFLITQDPTLLSTAVRKLSGVHRHFMRKFGSHWVTIHEWAGVRETVAKSRKDSISSQHRYPTDFFDKYVSAEKHTVKFGIPWKVVFVLSLPVLIGLGTWAMFFRVKATVAPPAAAAGATAQGPGRAASGSLLPGATRWVAPQTSAALAASMKPRIAGLPFTAPRYDELSAPVRIPVIVGCVVIGDKDPKEGWCVTQQGTRVVPPMHVMVSFVQSGQFVDYQPGPDLGSDASQADVKSAGARLPVAH